MAARAGRRGRLGGVHEDLLARRVDYPILERKAAYLINNSLGAMHRGTRDRLAEFADLWDTDGVVAWATWFPEMTRVADLLGTIIGAPTGTTILRQSVADALNAVVSCLDFTGARNRVVTTAADWPGTHYMWAEHCRRHGGELVVVPYEPDGVTIDAQRVADAVDDRTLVVSVSLVQFRTSTLLDLPPVRDAARRHGALLVLDAYQAVGAVPVDVAAQRRRRLRRRIGEVPLRRAGQRLALHPPGSRRVAASERGRVDLARATVRLRVGRDRVRAWDSAVRRRHAERARPRTPHRRASRRSSTSGSSGSGSGRRR